MELIVAQTFGIAAFLFGLITFLQKSDQRLKIYMLCLFLCQVVHFYLMGAATATAANLLNALRTFISLKFNRAWIGVVFLLINIVWGAYLYQSPISILPIIGSCIGTYSLFFMTGIRMRLAFVLGALCWLTHNAFIYSIGGVLLETIVIFGNIFTIIRLRQTPVTAQA